MTADNKEERECVEFSSLLGKLAAETVLLQETFKEEALTLQRGGI